MSKSYKKVNISKRNGSQKESYWKTIRRKVKQEVKKANDLEELEISIPREVVSDFDYTDEIQICEKDEDCLCMQKYGRKKCNQK